MQNNFISINLIRKEKIEQIFNIINNIEHYCEFLPFCKNIIVQKEKIYRNAKNEKIIKRIAKVDINYLGLSHQYSCIILSNIDKFTIDVFIEENKHIKNLYVKWSLNKLNENCKLTIVNFKMKYTLQYELLNIFAKKILSSQVKYTIKLFEKRLESNQL